MIKKCDSEQLIHYFPNADWDDLYWGFSNYSRQAYAGLAPLDAEDEIMLGLYFRQGGCLCEMGISWHLLRGRAVPQLEVFSEAWHLLKTPTFRAVLDQLTKEKESLATPAEVSALLIACGFTDQSNRPLTEVDPEHRADSLETSPASPARDKYIVLVTPTQAVSMIADLGNGQATENGDRSSQYFTIAKGYPHTGRTVSAALIENKHGLAADGGYYTLHIVDDVSGKPCELHHTDDLSEVSLVSLLKEILDGLENGGGPAMGEAPAVNGKFDMSRTLELTIRFDGDTIEVDVYEPESGEIAQLQHPYSPDEHPEFDKAIGDELYSWLNLWAEEKEEHDE